MGCEFLSEVTPTQEKSYGEIFEENFPFYLAIGMSYREYWEGDAELARYFRKAYMIKQEEQNHLSWLQGLYIYDALTTSLHNALRDKKTQKRDYPKKPYEFNHKEKTEKEKAREVAIEQQKAAAWMENFVRINQKRA